MTAADRALSGNRAWTAENFTEIWQKIKNKKMRMKWK